MRKIAARKTTLAKVEVNDATDFIREHHRQGIARAGSGLRSYGLYLNDELLAVAMFCNPRTRGMQKKYTTELFRMAFKSNVRVQGGASKLIKNFMATGAIDLFTYQDLSGETTDVYAHSGLTMISEQKSKDILVANGKTFATAANNRRDWFSIEQVVRFGPDVLLGTSLGEVYKDGKRSSNIELFQGLGYHLETVPGDRIYEWRNPEVRFYTYRVSSTQSPGYYIGRKLFRNTEHTEDDLLLDGYFGSGGKKFKGWLESVDSDSLVKEILAIHKDWPSAIAAEYATIGDSYKDDLFCMNSQPGGMGLGASIANLRSRECSVHGQSIHNGNSCMKCASAKMFTQAVCEIHGTTTFKGDNCSRCSDAKRYSLRNCVVHGEANHRDGICLNCLAGSSVSIRNCDIHGFVKHQGASCSSCSAQSGVSMAICAIHGKTKFRGETCSKCSSMAVISLRQCTIHGESKHSGDHCMKCNAEAQISRKICEIHGESTHKGNTCTNCTVEKSISLKECPIHGLTKHQGSVCNSCNAQKSISQQECLKHGLTTHQGSVCNSCNAEKSVSEQKCSVHGLSKFQGEQCVKCRNGSLISLRQCPTHGESKHRGESCMRCAQSNRRKPEDVLAERGYSEEDVRAASEAGETLGSMVRRFGISKHHLKRIAAQ